MEKKRTRTGWIVLLAALLTCTVVLAVSDSVRFVVLSMADYVVYGFPSDSDKAEAETIINRMSTVHQFSHNSLSRPDRPPVFANAGSRMILRRPTEITIYDIQDHAEQDRIAEALKQLSLEKKLKSFRVCFYDHENWPMTGNIKKRGPETQLRCVAITGERVRDIAGEKVITYPVP